MKTALITGGSGFFGGILKRRLLREGWKVVNIDLQKDDDTHENLTSIQGDIRDAESLQKIFAEHSIDVVHHCAAILAHAIKDKNFLWTSNVDGTQVVVATMKEAGVKTIIFTSSNCLWGEPIDHAIKEDEPTNPVEIYGESKLEGEKILQKENDNMNIIIIRCPTIVDAGRLGLLAILFEFIDEGRKVWVVGGGNNRYQFIYGDDLATACIKASDYQGSALWHIGADNVKPLKEVYQAVIDYAKTKARVASLPRGLTLFGMKIAYMLGLSPLGPYQYKMIAENFEFDTSKIKTELKWQPTVSNDKMLTKSYDFYRTNKDSLKAGDDVSAHRQPAKMGIIRLLKWLS